MKSSILLTFVFISGFTLSQTLPADCKAGFTAPESDTKSGCNVCNATFGRKRTNPTTRILEERFLQVKKADYSCAKCTQASCDDCSAVNHTSCAKCKDTFFLKAPALRVLQAAEPADSVCTKCITPCATCTSATSCLSCLAGFRFDTTKKLCENCPANCSECATSALVCTKCAENFTTTADGKCIKCFAGCKTCSAAETCSECSVAGFGPEATKKKCEKCTDTNCAACATDNTKCTACAPGFGLDTAGKCTKCTVSNCNACSTKNTECSGCISKFFANANKCESCSEGCDVCTALNNCTKCLDGSAPDATTKMCKKTPFFKKAWFWILVLIVLVLIVVAVMFLKGKGSDDPEV